MSEGSYRQVIANKVFTPSCGPSSSGPLTTTCSKIVVSLVAVEMAIAEALFSGYAGQLADVYRKRRVLIVTKSRAQLSESDLLKPWIPKRENLGGGLSVQA